MNNPYQPIGAVLEDVIVENPVIKTLVLKLDKPLDFKAGQFVMLTAPGVGESPFTPSSSCFDTEKIEITIQKQPKGKVTSALHNMKPGETIGVRGPFGYGYPTDKFKGNEVYVVGGGVGMAPMRALMLALLHEANQYKSIILRYGAREPALRIYKDLCKSWETDPRLNAVYTVDLADETWSSDNQHCVGVVPTIMHPEDIQDVKNAFSVSCGPPIMLRFIVPVLLKMGFTSDHMYFSLEKNMSCGMGLCGHCRIGDLYVCRDGADFSYEKIKDYPDAWA